MSIPKTIHYCWFGGNPLPKLAKKCIKSWRKYCPNYKIIEWNESNFDISKCPLYVRQAYESKKWAFVTDYVRLRVVYENGGIYLDTDVELIKPLDELLKYEAYFGFEDGKHIATGLGFGANAGNELIKAIMDDYSEIPFVLEDGTMDLLACPERNTRVLSKFGLLQNDEFQIIRECAFLPTDYLCPLSFENKKMKITENTLSIHRFSASWHGKEEKKKQKEKVKQLKRYARIERNHKIKHLPNFIIMKVLGERRYEKLKQKMKHH